MLSSIGRRLLPYGPNRIRIRYLRSGRKAPVEGVSKVESVESVEPLQDSALSFASKYKVFQDIDSTVVRDATEPETPDTPSSVEDFDEFEGLNLQRGLTGVFDIEDLVDVLKRENVKNIFVCRVPPQQNFVKYMCIVSSRSSRHMLATAEFIRKLYKRKLNKNEELPKIEGKTSTDWMAMDLGNIAFHIFNEQARKTYDLEQLWSVGPKFDHECLKADSDIIKLLEQHSFNLDDLRPADDDEDHKGKNTKSTTNQ